MLTSEVNWQVIPEQRSTRSETAQPEGDGSRCQNLQILPRSRAQVTVTVLYLMQTTGRRFHVNLLIYLSLVCR